MRNLIYILIIFTMSFHSPVFGEEIEKQDCEIMKNKDDSFSFGWKIGGFGWGVGPEISFKNTQGINWHNNVQYMIAEYQELCSRYNTGRISKYQYHKEIRIIIERSRNYRKEMSKIIQKKKQLLFNELEKENLK